MEFVDFAEGGEVSAVVPVFDRAEFGETSLDLLMHLVDATGCKRRFTFCMFFRRNREGA
jgi:hypothetical protein